MINFLRRLFLGEAPSCATPKRRLVTFDLPPEFAEVADPTPIPDKPHYASPVVQAFATTDNAVLVRVITEHDHDGIDFHRKDARRMYSESGADIVYTQFRDDSYSMGGTLRDGMNVHQTASGFGDAGKSATIGTVVMTFKDAKDARATALIRLVTERLSLSES